MIVELVGTSGAGKTTLARMLGRHGGPEAPVILSSDLIMDRPGRRWITNPTARNLVADVTAFPSFLRGPQRDREFVRFAWGRLKRYAPSRTAKLNYLREIVRNVGTHELARRSEANATVIVDEGAVLTAYHLFVYSRASFGQDDLERFAGLVPLPDRIIHVTAPLDVLVDRAMRRPDRRRELLVDRVEVERRIARALDVFEGLVQTPAIRERALTIANVDGSRESRRALVSQVSSFIHDRTPADATRSPVPVGAPRP
jgi:dephospho-CoA kinase